MAKNQLAKAERPVWNRLLHRYRDGQELNYLTHICRDPKFIYFETPIVGCSTIKASLNTNLASSRGEALTITSLDAIHRNKSLLLDTPSAIGMTDFLNALTDPSYFKFAFTREPIGRVRTAWTKKLSNQTGNIAYSTIQYLKAAGHEVDLSWENFVRLLSIDEKFRNLDSHWRPLNLLIPIDFCDKIIIFRLENLSNDLRDVLRHLFSKEFSSIIDARKIDATNSANRDVLPSVTAEQHALLQAAYREDFKLLDGLVR